MTGLGLEQGEEYQGKQGLSSSLRAPLRAQANPHAQNALATIAGELRVLGERLTVGGRGGDALTKAQASVWAIDLAKVARDAGDGENIDPDLAKVIERWGELSPEMRRAVMRMMGITK